MIPDEYVRSEYLRWMYELVCTEEYTKLSFRKLFAHLDSVEFRYSHPLDSSRYEDGVNLRYRFGREAGIEDSRIAYILDKKPCSVLEMLIALAIRCEESIMEDSRYGDRTGQWFWEMIVNLELGWMNDPNYDAMYVDERLDIFMDRVYDRNGEGGCLFRVKDPTRDMRTADIWYQMNWYLSEYFKEEYYV